MNMKFYLTRSLICLGNTGVSSFDLGSDDCVAGLVHAAGVADVVEGRLEGEHLRWQALEEKSTQQGEIMFCRIQAGTSTWNFTALSSSSILSPPSS